VECAVIDRAIAEKGHADAIRIQQLEGVARPGRLQDAGADDAAGSHHADFGFKEVHTAAAPA